MVVEISTYGLSIRPKTKSKQLFISDEEDGGEKTTHSELTPFRNKASNSTSPLRWNLTGSIEIN